jgi:hypothetical protein
VSKIAHKEGDFLFGLFGSPGWEKSPPRRRINVSGRPILGIQNSASPVCRAQRSLHYAQENYAQKIPHLSGGLSMRSF